MLSDEELKELKVQSFPVKHKTLLQEVKCSHGDAEQVVHANCESEEILNLTYQSSVMLQQIVDNATRHRAEESASHVWRSDFEERGACLCITKLVQCNSELAALREKERFFVAKESFVFRFIESLSSEIKGHETTMAKKPIFKRKSVIRKKFINKLCQKIRSYATVFCTEENKTIN